MIKFEFNMEHAKTLSSAELKRYFKECDQKWRDQKWRAHPFNVETDWDSYWSALEAYEELFKRKREEEGVITDDEREFRAKHDDVQKRIKIHLEEAMKHLDLAEAISNETGVPFESPISPVSNHYVPRSAERFQKIEELVDDFYDLVMSDYSGDLMPGRFGWQYSAVCYQ